MRSDAKSTGEFRSGASEAALQADGVSKVFGSARSGSITALDDVSLHVPRERFVSLVGPSGCGKTTLLMILAGLESATSGTVHVNGVKATGPSDDVGIVFQSPVLLPWKNVTQNTLLPATIRKRADRDAKARADELIRMVGLDGFREHLPHELSGGMQQRNAIARALLLNPTTLLMDEPFGALDAMTRERMNLELTRIWESERKAVVLVTHSISEAVFLSDEVIVMASRPGRIVDRIPVEMPRPRVPDLMKSTDFRDRVAHIRDVLDRWNDMNEETQ